jgi:predicted HTH transcriptional regulator
MFDMNTLENLSLLRESVDLECKLAQGQSGQGEIPKDFWSTYSAMANAYGGVVLLGVRENDGVFDCRNRTLHQMFLFINLGERAGSGLPKIRAGWEDMGHGLSLSDSFEPYEQTRLEMTWRPGFTGVLTETPVKTPMKTPVKTPVKTPDLILDAMNGNADITVQELAALLEKSESAINRAIRKLRDADQIRRIGGDKVGHWVVQK